MDHNFCAILITCVAISITAASPLAGMHVCIYVTVSWLYRCILIFITNVEELEEIFERHLRNKEVRTSTYNAAGISI